MPQNCQLKSAQNCKQYLSIPGSLNIFPSVVTPQVRQLKPGLNEPEEEEVYRDSKLFLKGTDSGNQHNDYLQHFVDTGQRPQNFIADASDGVAGVDSTCRYRCRVAQYSTVFH